MSKAIRAFLLLAVLGIAGYFYLALMQRRASKLILKCSAHFFTADRGFARRARRSPFQMGLSGGSRAASAGQITGGEYRFDENQTAWAIFNKISRGEIYFELFTVPEGSNTFDIASLLEHAPIAAGIHPVEFLKAAADATAIRDLDPGAPSLEGYLFPSTYRITHATTAAQLCHMMTSEFRKEWQTIAGPGPRQDVHRLVTLASLVEKESAQPKERPMVAGVFLNRLRLQMPLQCDPTTTYAALLENRYRGVIGKSDLASTNPITRTPTRDCRLDRLPIQAHNH